MENNDGEHAAQVRNKTKRNLHAKWNNSDTKGGENDARRRKGTHTKLHKNRKEKTNEAINKIETTDNIFIMIIAWKEGRE